MNWIARLESVKTEPAAGPCESSCGWPHPPLSHVRGSDGRLGGGERWRSLMV